MAVYEIRREESVANDGLWVRLATEGEPERGRNAVRARATSPTARFRSEPAQNADCSASAASRSSLYRLRMVTSLTSATSATSLWVAFSFVRRPAA